MRFLGVVLICIALAPSAFAQTRVGGTANRKQATATRVPNGSVRIDGRLDDDVWQKATPITDFIQKEPVENAAPTDRMEVRLLYDDDVLYVGARMFSRDGRIQAPLGRRDNTDQAEHLLVSFDTFLDRRTAVVFGVTAAGVRIDRFHSSDNEDSFDAGFDPVWRAETQVSGDQWTAELWIPFSQLRFNPQSDQIWGLNLFRFRPTLDEEDYWILIPRTVRAWSSRFGELSGIANLVPPRRIEALPYVAGGATINADRDTRNPFDDGKNLHGRVGADVKMGLGPNLTLETAINPDFGQVEADPAEVNLTAFATRFPEKRPFFLEGAQLFNIGHPNFYYSRRIGTRPIGPATGDYVEYPNSGTILAAAKLTGRLPSKTSLGFLTAVTDAEEAKVATRGVTDLRSVDVSPHAYHMVGRVLQEFGTSASSAGVLFNYVHRDFDEGSPLADLYTRNALGVAGNTLLRFRGGQYEFRASGGGSVINGTARAMERVQRASAHYAQRPDRAYSRLDPTLTSLGGWSVQMNFDKTGGRHWLWGGNTKIDSENFETNDFAQLNGADGILSNAYVLYRETRPNRWFRTYSVGVSTSSDTTLRLLRQAGAVRAQVNLTWANFWTTFANLSRNFAQTSVALTRGGAVDGSWPGLDLQSRCRQPRHFRDSLVGELPTGRQRRRREDAAGDRIGVDASGPALAVHGVTVLRPRDRAAAVHQYPVGRPSGDLQQPLHLFVHRPQHGVDGVPPRPDAAARLEPGCVRGAVCRLGPLLRLRRAAGARQPRADQLRRFRHHADDAARRQSGGDDRRGGDSVEEPRLQHAVIPQQRGLAVGMARWQHALRGVAAGSRGIGSARHPCRLR